MPRRLNVHQDKDETYHRTIPLKQKNIADPVLRRSIRAKHRATVPRLSRDNTLTQMWDMAIPSTGKTGGDESENDGQEEQPRKKRKRNATTPSASKKRQQRNTLTQMVRSGSTVDEEDVCWKDLDGVAETAGETAEQKQERTARILRQTQLDTAEDEENAMLLSQRSGISEASPTNTEAEALPIQTTSGPKTPRIIRIHEIPSSQTPPSTRLSTQRRVRRTTSLRSPLKDRSANVPSPLRSPEKAGDASPTKMQFLNGEVQLVQHQSPLDGISLKAPRLKHMSTIDDSQQEDTPVVQQSPPRWQFRRWSTVQDSQFEDFDASSSPVHNIIGDDFEPQDGDDATQNEAYDDVDPVFSALDRDAARYRRTQASQALEITPLREIDADDHDDFVDIDEVLSSAPEIDKGGCGVRAPLRAASPTMTETKQPPASPKVDQYTLADVNDTHKVPIDVARPDEMAIAGSVEPSDFLGEVEEGVQKSLEPGSDTIDFAEVFRKPLPPKRHTSQAIGIDRLASSPPPISPSQVSTVDITQRSSQHFTFSSSPGNHADTLPEILSSSPLPLPPWTSPERHYFAYKTSISSPVSTMGKRQTQLDSLVDFSLPPPPPMSSWRSSGGGARSTPSAE